MGKITRKQAITAINLTIDQLYMKVMTGEGTKRYWSEDEKTLSSFHEDMLRLERCLSDKEFQKELRVVPVQELQEYYLLIIELSRAYDLPSKAFLESHTLIENRKKTITRMFLNILLGKEQVDRIWAEPFYDGFMELSDKILFTALEVPCTVVGEFSDYVGFFALASGNIPIVAMTEATSKTADMMLFGATLLQAYISDDWTNVYKQAASKIGSSFVSFRVKGIIADIRVVQKGGNGHYYQKKHRGNLSNKSEMRREFIKKMAPEIAEKVSEELFNKILDEIQLQMEKQED